MCPNNTFIAATTHCAQPNSENCTYIDNSQKDENGNI